MSTLTIFLLILVAGVATFAIRFSFIFFAGRVKMPYYFEQGLRFVPVTVLTALILPNLLSQDAAQATAWGNPRLIAGLVAVGVAFYSKNVLVTMAVGMVVLWTLQSILG